MRWKASSALSLSLAVFACLDLADFGFGQRLKDPAESQGPDRRELKTGTEGVKLGKLDAKRSGKQPAERLGGLQEAAPSATLDDGKDLLRDMYRRRLEQASDGETVGARAAASIDEPPVAGKRGGPAGRIPAGPAEQPSSPLPPRLGRLNRGADVPPAASTGGAGTLVADSRKEAPSFISGFLMACSTSPTTVPMMDLPVPVGAERMTFFAPSSMKAVTMRSTCST